MKIIAMYKTNDNTTDVMILEKEKVEIRDGYIFTYNRDGVMTSSHSLDKFINISIER